MKLPTFAPKLSARNYEPDLAPIDNFNLDVSLDDPSIKLKDRLRIILEEIVLAEARPPSPLAEETVVRSTVLDDRLSCIREFVLPVQRSSSPLAQQTFFSEMV
jgi:hypothetical protein